MTETPDITPVIRTRQLLDDLLWLRTGVVWDRQDAVDKMLADYTTDPDHYSNGTPVEEQYDPAALDPSLYFLGSSVRPLLPPHRRDAEQERYVRAYVVAREGWEQAVAAAPLPSYDDDELPPF